MWSQMILVFELFELEMQSIIKCIVKGLSTISKILRCKGQLNRRSLRPNV